MNVGTAVFSAAARFGPLIKGAEQVSQALGKVKQYADQLGPATEKSTGRMSGALQKVWGGASKALKGGAIATGAAVGGILSASMVKGMGRLVAIDDARAKLRGLGHDAEGVEGIMGSALKSVQGTAFGLQDAATTAAGAVAAGINQGDDLTRYLKIVADAAAISGTSLSEMGQVMNRVQTAGVAMSEDLNMLSDRGIPILQWLADEYGVTTVEMKKMVSEGAVDAATYAKVIEDNIGGAALKMGDSFSGALANLWASIGRIGANFLEPLFNQLQSVMTGLTGALGPIEDIAGNVGEKLGGALAGGIEALGKAWDGLVSSWKSGSGLVGGLKGLINLFSGKGTGALAQWLDVPQDHPAIKVLLSIKDMVTEGIPAGLRTVRDLFVGVFNVLTGQGTGLLAETLGVSQDHWMIDVIRGIRDVVSELFNYVVTTALPALWEFIEGFREGEGAGGLLRTALETAWTAASSLFGYIVDTAIPAIESLWNWFKDNESILIVLAAMYAGYKAVIIATTAAQTAAAVVTKALAAAQTAGAVATKALAAAQKVLNAVMRMNPIGLVVAAITGLIAILVLAYRENETFRDIVDKAWARVKEVILGVVSWFRDTAWPWMRDALQWIGDKATWLYENAIKPAWNRIKDTLSSVGSWIKDTLWPWIRDAFGSISDRAGWLKNKASEAFSGIKDGISNAWDGAKRILERFMGGLDSLRDKFGSVRDGIGRVWSTIGAAIARPINSVIDAVNNFLQKLQDGLNKIPGVDLGGKWGGIPHVPVPAATTSSASTAGYGGGKTGPVMLKDGSWVPGHSANDHADNIDARLTAGEFVTRRRSARQMDRNFPGWLEHVNRHGTPPGFAEGGRVGGTLGDALAGIGSDLLGLLTSPLDTVKGWISNWLGDIGGTWAGDAALGAVKNVASMIADWIKENVFGGADGPGGLSGPVGPAMGWQGIWALVKSLFPDAILTSAVRNSTVAGYGGVSLHALGRAVDFAMSPARMIAATKVLSQMMRWTELIHTPAGNWQQNRGVNTSNFLPITRANHWDHVHAAMRTGGWVPGTGSGDRTKVLAEPREFVVNRQAARRWGPMLQAINGGFMRSGTKVDLIDMVSDRSAGRVATLLRDRLVESGEFRLREDAAGTFRRSAPEGLDLSDESLDTLARLLDQHARKVSALTVSEHDLLTRRRGRESP